MEDITNADYTHIKRVCKDFKQQFRERPWFVRPKWYILLANIFNNFWNKCLVINGFDPAPFLSAPRLVWQAALKQPKWN